MNSNVVNEQSSSPQSHTSTEQTSEKTNEIYQQVPRPKTSSKTTTPRSKSSIKSSKIGDSTVNKPKKRVSFNDDLIQVHLIPFNNYTNCLSLEQYKYQLHMMQTSSIDPYGGYEDYDIPNENCNNSGNMKHK